MSDLSNFGKLKSLLHANNLRPKDYLGQNFLVDEDALQAIVRAADLEPTDVVLEVGPGLGVLTHELAGRVKQVIAVEKDERLATILKKKNQFRNLKVINSDILRFNLTEQISGPYKVVANIPYYLTSKLLQNFLSAEGGSALGGETQNKPTLMVLMVQKEVGERVTAPPGELSILGISVQVYADAEITHEVPKTSFWPVPEVDSVVLKITPRDKYPEIKDKKLFFRLIKMAFAGKRKQIHNTLTNGLKLPKEQIMQLLKEAGIDPLERPQDLQIDQWISLYQKISHTG